MSAAPIAQPGAGAGSRALLALTAREFIRLSRQPSRLVATVGTPALIWVLAGAGLGGAFRGPQADGAEAGLSYAAYLLPGMVTMVVVFSTVFASISLIQDRQAGLLQSVLVSPAPRWAVVLAKIVSGAVLSAAQAGVLLLGAPLVGLSPRPMGVLAALLAALLASAGVIGVGLSAAWRMNSIAGFHGVMNMVLMPMWLLSGSMFPAETASPWLGWLVRLNPLHACTSSIAHALRGQPGEAGWAWAYAAAFATFGFGLATLVMSRTKGASGVGGIE